MKKYPQFLVRSNMSGEKARIKMSKVTQLVNKFLIGTFLLQVSMCIVGATMAVINNPTEGDFYLMPSPESMPNFKLPYLLMLYII